MDLLSKATLFANQIKKLGDMKLLSKAIEAQESAAKLAEQAQKLYEQYSQSQEQEDK